MSRTSLTSSSRARSSSRSRTSRRFIARAGATRPSRTGRHAVSPRTTATTTHRAAMRRILPVLANVLKAWALVLGACAFLGAIGFAAGGYRLLSILVFCALLLAGGAYWYSDRVALGLVRARELPVGEAPALHSTVERLAAVARVAKPRLYLIPDGHPRALAAGRGPRGSALAFSAGLVAALTPAEVEGVIAHELAHVRSRDVVVQTAVVVLAGALVEMSRIGGWLERVLLFVLGPTAAAFVHLLLSPAREFHADRVAAQLCNSP